jgi:uncharacterized protein
MDAMRARDPIAVSALRTTLSAVANAEAVVAEAVAGGAGARDAAEAVAGGARARDAADSHHFAGGMAGLGAGEAARRQLSAADVDAIVRAEIAEREHAAADYAAKGLSSQAERLRREASILTAVVGAPDST